MITRNAYQTIKGLEMPSRQLKTEDAFQIIKIWATFSNWSMLSKIL